MYTRTWVKKKLTVLGVKTTICSYLMDWPCNLEESHDPPQCQEIFLRAKAEVVWKKQGKVTSDSHKTPMRNKSDLQIACGSRMGCSQLSLAEPTVGKPFTGAAHLQDCPLVDQSCLCWNLQKFYAISNADYLSFNHSQSWCQKRLCPVRPPATPLLRLLDRRVGGAVTEAFLGSC